MEPRVLCDACVGIDADAGSIPKPEARRLAKKKRIERDPRPYVWLSARGNTTMIGCKICRNKVASTTWDEHVQWHKDSGTWLQRPS